MIADFIEQVGPWAWVIGGLLLLGLEIMLPGTFFLWLGISAMVVGAVSLIFDIAWQVQVVVFVALALVLVVFGRRYFKNRPEDKPEVIVNQRGTQLVGSTYVLSAPIVDGSGRVKVGDSFWRVIGPDCPSGTRVKVVAVDGSVLRVEPVNG
jgi:membrane protein implicated in regulation of membrane protease activity